MIVTTKARTALTVIAASLSLAALTGAALATTHTDGAPGAANAYNWDIPAGTASPSA